ncbi:MAG: TlpA disulfide reductase family protein [Balneolaceae bacterium]
MILLFISNCENKNQVNTQFVQNKFKAHSDEIYSLQFRAQRIDTLQNGRIWNNSGFAIIEKNNSDELFGFSFFGKRVDIQLEYIYDSGNGFEISHEKKSYRLVPPNGILGAPGGQLIPQNIFNLDSVYKNVSLLENNESYILTYEFEDDLAKNQTQIVKTVRINKTNFLPQKIKSSFLRFGNKYTTEIVLSDVKINQEVSNTILDLKDKFKEYTLIVPEKKQQNEILSHKLPALNLPGLFDSNKVVTIKTDKVTLIDFWEAWCTPCIVSFPKIEKLKKKYSKDLTVIGIVSDNLDNAIKLVKEKGGTYQHYIGNESLEENFGVYSWPRYFLVDKSGVIRNEYHGFSEQIELDIQDLISK